MNKIEKSRELRKNLTKQERKLWNILRNRQFYNFRFRRKFPIGNYIADFVCREKKIVIAIDEFVRDINYLKARAKYLNSFGYSIVNFCNDEIDNDIVGVCKTLQTFFAVTPP